MAGLKLHQPTKVRRASDCAVKQRLRWIRKRIIKFWRCITDELGRSLGQRDHYPFVLTPTIIDKLLYVQAAVAGAPGNTASAA